VNLCRSGLRTLQDVDAPIAGAVLNAVNLNRHEYNYYHYYYYKREGYAPLAGTVAAVAPAGSANNDRDDRRPSPPN
jgi:succinoglycan biosynthesis transport protein ExoP